MLSGYEPTSGIGPRGATHPPRKDSKMCWFSNHDHCHVQCAERVLNAIKDAESASEESVHSNKTDSDDKKSNGDNDYHANVASALLGSNW